MAVATRDITNSLGLVYATKWSAEVSELLFAPDKTNGAAFTLGEGFALLDASAVAAGRELVPLCVVDDESLAVVVVEGEDAGLVLRWFLGPIDDRHQGQLLDVDPLLYVNSLQEELAARESGLNRVLDEIGPAYEETHLAKERRPRDFVVRPVRIACQNVIVALGAVAQDASFDGLSVTAWQTCEVPHVATHEANRALAALTLADAFQNGGTMEIRFDRPARITAGEETRSYSSHPEGAIPASLRRFGRTVGVILGAEHPCSISPAEARALFMAITPMPPSLRARVVDATERCGITPERLCFTLLSQIWREIELDFILGCSQRAGSILEGGADWQSRSIRQSEMDICRAAQMIGMLYRRMNTRDSARAEEGARVVEDLSLGVGWEVVGERGAVAFSGIDPATEIPWMMDGDSTKARTLTVFPRTFVTEDVVAQVNRMHAEGQPVALAVPRDTDVADEVIEASVLRCPDRIADLDKRSEVRLLTSRISRS